MRKFGNVSISAFTTAALFTMPTSAHHGLGEYDQTNLMQLEGKVVGFELRDPHSLLFVDVENPDGSLTSWAIEGGLLEVSWKPGLAESSFPVGQWLG